MNRVERLTGILLLLQDRPRNSEEIARRFEVSKRTVLRDVQALCEIGVPVIAREGLGGGYSLPHDYSLAPLPLTTHEAFLLLLSLRLLSRLADAPFGAARVSLLAKLRAVLPQAQMPEVERWLSAVDLSMPRRATRAPFLDALIAAAQAGQWVRAGYASAERESVQHLLPRQVTARHGYWYCRAFSAEHLAERSYRVDRFQSVGQPAPGFCPPAAPPAPAYDDAAHPQVRATLTARGAALAEADPDLEPARQAIPDAAHAIERRADGAAELCFRCPPAELDWYARFFASLGAEVQVQAPPELRARLRALGQLLAERYGPV